MILFFFVQSEGSRNIIALGTIPLATIEKFSKIVSYKAYAWLTSHYDDCYIDVKFLYFNKL